MGFEVQPKTIKKYSVVDDTKNYQKICLIGFEVQPKTKALSTNNYNIVVGRLYDSLRFNQKLSKI